MAKPKAPLPRRAGGRREEQSLIIRGCRVFVDNYANLLRVGLLIGGLHFIANLTEHMAENRAGPADVEQRAQIEYGNPESTVDAPAAEPEPLSAAEKASMERIRHITECTRRDYQRENYSECGLEDSDIYRQEEIFKDDGTLTIFDVETLYADT